MTVIETETARPGEYPQVVRMRNHTLNADAGSHTRVGFKAAP